MNADELREKLESNAFLKRLNTTLLPKVIAYIISCGGTKEEADDLYQEALIALYKRSLDPSFAFTVQFDTFFLAIVKKKYLHESRKKINHSIPLSEEATISLDESTRVDEFLIKEERVQLFREHFDLIPEGCRNLLALFFNSCSMKEIARKMGFASEAYARKRKHQCKHKLMESIKADARYKEIANG